jgi:hypothetical protein
VGAVRVILLIDAAHCIYSLLQLAIWGALPVASARLRISKWRCWCCGAAPSVLRAPGEISVVAVVMRWRTALAGLAVASLSVLLWSRIEHSVDELSPRFSDPATPTLTSRVRARAAAVPLPAALLEPQRDFASPTAAAVPVSAAAPVVSAPSLPQRCTEAWIPGVANTRCVQA